MVIYESNVLPIGLVEILARSSEDLHVYILLFSEDKLIVTRGTNSSPCRPQCKPGCRGSVLAPDWLVYASKLPNSSSIPIFLHPQCEVHLAESIFFEITPLLV